MGLADVKPAQILLCLYGYSVSCRVILPSSLSYSYRHCRRRYAPWEKQLLSNEGLAKNAERTRFRHATNLLPFAVSGKRSNELQLILTQSPASTWDTIKPSSTNCNRSIHNLECLLPPPAPGFALHASTVADARSNAKPTILGMSPATGEDQSDTQPPASQIAPHAFSSYPYTARSPFPGHGNILPPGYQDSVPFNVQTDPAASWTQVLAHGQQPSFTSMAIHPGPGVTQDGSRYHNHQVPQRRYRRILPKPDPSHSAPAGEGSSAHHRPRASQSEPYYQQAPFNQTSNCEVADLPNANQLSHRDPLASTPVSILLEMALQSKTRSPNLADALIGPSTKTRELVVSPVRRLSSP
ncbi:hypothetical protein FB45DRAFT_869468 [Roridomyces roridus]|uniref:Uncharacterized protein n=1 Tax=Roridomyces roridus TaxID=1738132 RepID=A0AAD7BM11_9AGAR|nr:hypothetical protein FB45DRAFT_869468 [Roridomyces roridus]